MKKLWIFILFIPLTACGTDGADYIVNKTAFCTGFRELDIECFGTRYSFCTEFEKSTFCEYVEKNEPVCRNENDILLSGRIVEYYDNGKIKRDFVVKNGLPDGEFKSYYPNKKLAATYTFKDGKLDGVSKKYYESGQLLAETTFRNNKQDGIQKFYLESGRLINERKYVNGEKAKMEQKAIREQRTECEKRVNRCELEPTKGCRAHKSGIVFSIAKDGLVMKDGNDLWFLYTDKDYVEGRHISSVMNTLGYFEYVGTYEYKTVVGSVNRINAYKTTQIPTCLSLL